MQLLNNDRHIDLNMGSCLAMAHVVSRWSLNSEARVCARISPRGICGRNSSTGSSLSPSYSAFSCQYNSITALQNNNNCII
jgi:hypothetical protein